VQFPAWAGGAGSIPAALAAPRDKRQSEGKCRFVHLEQKVEQLTGMSFACEECAAMDEVGVDGGDFGL